MSPTPTQCRRDANGRLERLTEAMRSHLEHWRMRPVVEALMTLRGVDLIAAMTLVIEIRDFTRFARPRELMGFLGLCPRSIPAAANARGAAVELTVRHFPAHLLQELNTTSSPNPAPTSRDPCAVDSTE